MTRAHFILSLILLLGLSGAVSGQTATTSRISGTVTDAQGARVSGATVTLTEKATGSQKVATTNQDGTYVFASIAPGLYDITVSAQGFRQFLTAGVSAEVAKAVDIDVALQPGGNTEQVTVTATAEAQLQKDDASLGNVLAREQIQRLPTPDGSVNSLMALNPGVSPTGEVTGARGDQNMFNLDGIDVSDNIGFLGNFATAVPIPKESVEEMRFTVSNADASFGRSSGGQVTLVTRRGSNAFHGSLYEYFQNTALNANQWDLNRIGLSTPKYNDNRYGGTIGGPIWKNKLFFFFNYEGERIAQSETLTRVVPTASFRAGILTFRDATGHPFTINPKALDPRGLGANSMVLHALDLEPLPNTPGFGDGLNTSGFTFAAPATTQNDTGVLRLDYQITEKWSFMAKGSAQRFVQNGLTGQADLITKTDPGGVSQRPRDLTFAVVGQIRSNLVNEFRVGRAYINFYDHVHSPDTTSGFNVAVNFAPVSSQATPALSLLDAPIDVDTQRARTQSIYGGNTQFLDNLTWTKGTHTFQFGGDFRRVTTFHERNDKVIGSLADPVAEIGQAQFTKVPSAQRPPTCAGGVTTDCIQQGDLNRYNEYYSTLLGIVDSVGYLAVRNAQLQPLPPGTPLVNDALLHHWEFYFADTWKLTPNLTLSYGLMYQWHTPPEDTQGRQTVLEYAVDNPAGQAGQVVDTQKYLDTKLAMAEAGKIFNPKLQYETVDAANHAVFNTQRHDLAPSFSVAWQPSFKSGILGHVFGDHKSVIRGGYRISYDRLNTISSVVVPMLGVGFAQTLTIAGPMNGAGQPFRAGVDGNIPLPANFATKNPIVPAAPFGELLSFTMDPHVKDPYNHSVDFSIQRELPGNMMIEVAYVGRFARNLLENTDLNSVPYMFKDLKSGQIFAQAYDNVSNQLRAGVNPAKVTPQPWFENQLGPGGTRLLATNDPADFEQGSLNTLWNEFMDFLVPNSFNNNQILSNFVRTANGVSNYNALVVSLQKRTSHGLAFTFNYTYSKSLDQIGAIQNFVNTYSNSMHPGLDYGPSTFDHRHIINGNFIYDLPFGKGKMFDSGNHFVNQLIGGWDLTGVVQAASGAPLSVLENSAGNAFGGSTVGFATGAAIPLGAVSGQGVHGNVSGSGGFGTSGNPSTGGSGLNLFGNPAAVAAMFRPVEISQDTRTGIGAFTGLSHWQLDLGLHKQFVITERLRFKIGADAFNIFNHPNFADPNLDLSNPSTFGVITNQLVYGSVGGQNTTNAFYRPRALMITARIDF